MTIFWRSSLWAYFLPSWPQSTQSPRKTDFCSQISATSLQPLCWQRQETPNPCRKSLRGSISTSTLVTHWLRLSKVSQSDLVLLYCKWKGSRSPEMGYFRWPQTDWDLRSDSSFKDQVMLVQPFLYCEGVLMPKYWASRRLKTHRRVIKSGRRSHFYEPSWKM